MLSVICIRDLCHFPYRSIIQFNKLNIFPVNQCGRSIFLSSRLVRLSICSGAGKTALAVNTQPFFPAPPGCRFFTLRDTSQASPTPPDLVGFRQFLPFLPGRPSVPTRNSDPGRARGVEEPKPPCTGAPVSPFHRLSRFPLVVESRNPAVELKA